MIGTRGAFVRIGGSLAYAPCTGGPSATGDLGAPALRSHGVSRARGADRVGRPAAIVVLSGSCPWCGNPMEPLTANGQRRRWCSPQCRVNYCRASQREGKPSERYLLASSRLRAMATQPVPEHVARMRSGRFLASRNAVRALADQLDEAVSQASTRLAIEDGERLRAIDEAEQLLGWLRRALPELRAALLSQAA